MAKKKPSEVLADETPWPIGRNPVGAEVDHINGVLNEKLAALLDKYGIDGDLSSPEAGWELAFRLAHEYVEGFAPKKKKAPQRPNDLKVGLRDAVMVYQYEQYIEDGLSQRAASEKLVDWLKEEWGADWKASTIRTRCRELSKQPSNSMIQAAQACMRIHRVESQ